VLNVRVLSPVNISVDDVASLAEEILQILRFGERVSECQSSQAS
jgi:hypothetical protein